MLKTARQLRHAAAILALAAAGTAQAADTPLTAKQLAATIPGQTLTAKHQTTGKQLVLIYSAGSTKGTFGGTYDGKPNNGTWRIKGNKWCEDWGRGNGCWRIVQTDAKTLYFFNDDGSLFYKARIK